MSPEVITLFVAAAGSLAAYLAAVRRFSGKIESSDAKELWAESKSIREILIAEIATLKTEVEGMRRRATECEERENTLRERIAVLEATQ